MHMRITLAIIALVATVGLVGCTATQSGISTPAPALAALQDAEPAACCLVVCCDEVCTPCPDCPGCPDCGCCIIECDATACCE